MKRIFLTGIRQDYLDLLLLVLRLSIALLMIRHGLPKLSMLLEGGEIQFGDPIGLGPGISLALAVFAELFCSALVGIGLGTRLASLPLLFTMAVAAFITHGPDPFARKEMAILYLLFYITLLITGGGKYSLDYLLTRNKRI